MSDYEKKDMTGVLFANKEKKAETDPNAKGDCLIDGVEYWVSAWTNTAKSGTKYQKLSFTKKKPVSDFREEVSQPDDSDIPF